MTKGELSENFKGTTNSFSTGSGSVVLILPKAIIEELKLDIEKKKAHFHIFFDKKRKEIMYKFIGEESKW